MNRSRTDQKRRRGRVIRYALAAAITAGVALAAWPTNILSLGVAPAAAESMGAFARPGVTFSKDVAPILYANCVACHHAGEAGPFPLVTYGDAKKHADLIAQTTQSKLMPPWKAEANYGHFLNERRLTDAQIATITQWAAAGAPQGDPAAAPPLPTFVDQGWPLGKPDLVVTTPQPFTVPAGGRDVFRCFVIPLNIPKDQYVTAVEFRPSDRKVVHHALLFLDRRGQARAKDEQFHKDNPADTQPGFPSFGGPGFQPTGGLGGWAPGATAGFLPDGVARPLAAGSDLIIQTHFHPTGKIEVEQSSVAIYFSKTPPKHVLVPMVLANRQIDIPAGKKDYEVTADADVAADLSVIGIAPHAHLICRQMEVWATLPATKDEAEKKLPLIKIDDWDFNWQGQYRYAEPVHLPKGAVIHMRYVYDNSAGNIRNPNDPPAEIRFGEQTTNEMAFCFLDVIPDNPADAQAIRRATVLRALKSRLTPNK